MSASRKDHLSAHGSEPLAVVIIGNGPSGICLSYLLSGYTPYVRPGAVHPHPLLQRKLAEAPGVSILDQVGLAARGQSCGEDTPALWKTPQLPWENKGKRTFSGNKAKHTTWASTQIGRGNCAGAQGPSFETHHCHICLSHRPLEQRFSARAPPCLPLWGRGPHQLHFAEEEPEALSGETSGQGPQLVRGGAERSAPGPSTAPCPGGSLTAHPSSFPTGVLRNSRATAGDIAHYYRDYVTKKGLSHHFMAGAVVTAVRWGAPGPSGPGAQEPGPLFQVSGFLATEEQSPQPFSLSARNVVLATGMSDSPARLDVPGEDLPFVHHGLAALEAATRAGAVTPASDPVLIVGAGLSAADAVLHARHYGVPVIHAFRRPVDDPGLVFNQLPKMLYPEYHKVHQMMREQSILSPGPYEGYRSLPQHRLLLLKEDRRAVFRDARGREVAFDVSLALVLIGSYPDLSFLPGGGADLAVDPEQPLSAKRNPVDVDPFTYQSPHREGLYALGPLAGDSFVRFVQGGALAVASSLQRKEIRKPP
nr:LOW QUALITY PROTEIN: oxidative stress-induced growth inhibitor 1 [Dasypus novemcinctus]